LAYDCLIYAEGEAPIAAAFVLTQTKRCKRQSVFNFFSASAQRRGFEKVYRRRGFEVGVPE